MSKVSALVKLSIAFVFCMTIVNCGNKTTAQSAEAAAEEAAEAKGKLENFVITDNPDQLLDISNDMLEYLKSAHIESEKDVKDYEEVMADMKELLSAVQDTLNARLEVMNPEEKGDMVAKVTTVSEKMEDINPAIMKELQRLEMEAKKIGITLPIDL